MYKTRIKNAQTVLRTFAGYAGAIDGEAGPVTLAAALRIAQLFGTYSRGEVWPPERRVIAAAQSALREAGFDTGKIDGFYGPQTDAAFLSWRASTRGRAVLDRAAEEHWGSQANMEARFGPAGAAICTAGEIVPPWRMVLAWDAGQVVRRFNCHADVAASGQRAFDRIAETYSTFEINGLGLHLYGGCYNFRKKRGGSSLSTHAWGVAIDFDPARNRLDWGRDRARLARVDAAPFWDAWEAEGWLSLGRARDYDWMHVQAPAL